MGIPKQTHKPRLDEAAALWRTKLTDQQERFCRIFATEEVTREEAAIKAGYAPASAAAQASGMLNHNPRVIQRVAEIKSELGRKYEVTFEKHVQKLAEIRDQALADGKYAAAVNAEKSRGQAAGLYIDRKEIYTGDLDKMGKDEVISEIKRLQQEYPALKKVAETSTIDGETSEVIEDKSQENQSEENDDGNSDLGDDEESRESSVSTA